MSMLRCILIGLFLLFPSLGAVAGQHSDAPPTGKQDQQQIYQQFLTASEDGQWSDARDHLIQLIAAKESENGPDSPELVVSLADLAAVELELEEWEAARDLATRGLRILDAQPEDITTSRMSLLLSSAKAEIGLWNSDAARDILYEALKVNKRVKPRDFEQDAEVHFLLLRDAMQEQSFRDGNAASTNLLKASTKHFGADSMEMVSYRRTAARWYRFSSQFRKERQQHMRIIELLEAGYGERNARLAESLRGIAATYMIPRRSPEKAKQALMRARDLEYPDDIEADILQVQVLSSLGDYYTVYEEPGPALELYEQAWHLMADNESIGADYANRQFANVMQLYFNSPDQPANSGKGGDYFTDGHVLMKFTVARTGHLEDIEILERKPLQMDKEQFYKAARKARYRPRIVDGEVVATSEQRFKFTYGLKRRP